VEFPQRLQELSQLKILGQSQSPEPTVLRARGTVPGQLRIDDSNGCGVPIRPERLLEFQSNREQQWSSGIGGVPLG
jgi:hypothetical protein